MMSLIPDLYYLCFLIVLQFKLIFPYWTLGILAGTAVSAFIGNRLRIPRSILDGKRIGFPAVAIAALLGAVSPICMYGTIPLIAALGRKGAPQHILAAFMVSSILINPNLLIFSFALGTPLAVIRLAVGLVAGVTAGLLVKLLLKGKSLFNFDGFYGEKRCTGADSSIKQLVKELHKAIVRTAPYFFAGIIFAALLEKYLHREAIVNTFGTDNGLAVLLAASAGVPLYLCGGGTVPLIRTLLDAGMSWGAAVAFMVTGPATKLTNLGAVKIIMGVKYFICYIVFNIIFALLAGWITDIGYVLLR